MSAIEWREAWACGLCGKTVQWIETGQGLIPTCCGREDPPMVLINPGEFVDVEDEGASEAQPRLFEL